MSASDFTILSLYIVLLLACAWPLGTYMARVYSGDPARFTRWLKPFENGCYRLCGVRATIEMTWKRYAAAPLLFNGLGLAAVYAL